MLGELLLIRGLLNTKGIFRRVARWLLRGKSGGLLGVTKGDVWRVTRALLRGRL